MRILELQDFAQGDKFNSLEFKCTCQITGKKTKGRWVDAYFGLFWIEGMKENTCTSVQQLRDNAGDERYDFTVLQEQKNEDED